MVSRDNTGFGHHSSEMEEAGATASRPETADIVGCQTASKGITSSNELRVTKKNNSDATERNVGKQSSGIKIGS